VRTGLPRCRQGLDIGCDGDNAIHPIREAHRPLEGQKSAVGRADHGDEVLDAVVLQQRPLDGARGDGLPQFDRGEFGTFLECAMPAHSLLRLHFA